MVAGAVAPGFTSDELNALFPPPISVTLSTFFQLGYLRVSSLTTNATLPGEVGNTVFGSPAKCAQLQGVL